MNFALSEEQEQLRDQARELLAKECPTARVREIMAREGASDAALWRTFAEAGWLGVLVPEEHGGVGLGMLDAALVAAELGAAVAPGPFVASSVGAAVALREGGSKAQQKAWLPRLAAGEATLALACAEDAESTLDPARIRMRAAKAGDGFRLDGAKIAVEAAGSAEALLVAARVPGKAGEVGLFLVPRTAPGVSIELLVGVDETRPLYDVRLRGVRVGKEALLPRGAKALPRALDACAVALAAESLGGAERALELAVAYVKVREQFGRPVGSFQAVQHLAAECVAKIEPARALVWYAAFAFDAKPKESALAAAMAKAACSDLYRAVSRTAIEMFGGIGFTFENDMHLWFKRALVNAAAWGDARWHRERVAALSGF